MKDEYFVLKNELCNDCITPGSGVMHHEFWGQAPCTSCHGEGRVRREVPLSEALRVEARKVLSKRGEASATTNTVLVIAQYDNKKVIVHEKPISVPIHRLAVGDIFDIGAGDYVRVTRNVAWEFQCVSCTREIESALPSLAGTGQESGTPAVKNTDKRNEQ